MSPVTVRDVTLREYGQTLPAAALDVFTPTARAWLARELMAAGFQTFEIASTASPRIAPAMADGELRQLLGALDAPAGVGLVTLVPPSRSAYGRFLALGLGPEGRDHLLGVFVSAMDAHNLANLGRPVEASLEALREILRRARAAGTRCVGYVSAAFGFVTPAGDRLAVSDDEVARLVTAELDAGVESVTLSDLQGLASPVETLRRFERLARLLPAGAALGYHAHHLDPELGLDNAVAAAAAGVRLFDGSLGAVGGCVTGAPGNVPTEGLVRRLASAGFDVGLDPERIESLAREVRRRIYDPVAEHLRANTPS